MPFEVPTVPINLDQHASDTVIRLNQRMEADIVEFMQDYEMVWGVSGQNVTDAETQEMTFVSNGSIYTLEQMQEKIDKMPQSVAVSMLFLAGMKRDMIVAAEQFLGEQYLPARYLSPAFTMQSITSPSDPVVLTGLAPAWTPPEE
jgi:hypothetical protein